MQDSEHGRWISDVVERYESALLRYAAHLTGNLEQGRDVVQDTFLKLCRQDRTTLDGHLTEWLYTVCRNRALDLCRKERRMKTLTAAPTEEPDSKQVAAIEIQESVDTLLSFLNRLSENQREVVRLKFQSGLSYRQIAAVTNLSVSNVGVLLHTAIKKLREEMRATWSGG